MKVREIIEANPPEMRVVLSGVNTIDEYDPWHESYFEGNLADIPEKYHNIDIVGKSFSLVQQCPVIEIPYQNNCR